jgi:DNA-binding MarR family transcriptional regulator
MEIEMKATSKECANLILETTPLVMRSMRTAVAQYVGSGTTLPQFRVLSHLNRDSQCLSDLAVRQHVSLATMSKIVTGLVERGYVERASEDRDRRYITLRLTPKGQRFFDQTNAHTRQSIAARIAALSSEERGRIVAGLRVLESVFKESEHHRRDEAPALAERKSK